MSKPADGRVSTVAGPGGIVICAEPDNLLHYIASDCKGYRQSVETRTAEFEFWLRHQRGKECVGDGYNAVGQDLVNLLRTAGLIDVQVYVSDKVPLSGASPTEESLSALKDMKQLLEQREGIFNPNRYRPYVEAGGGSSDVFDRGFHAFLERYERLLDANDLESIFTPGALYLASGRKPLASAQRECVQSCGQVVLGRPTEFGQPEAGSLFAGDGTRLPMSTTLHTLHDDSRSSLGLAYARSGRYIARNCSNKD